MNLLKLFLNLLFANLRMGVVADDGAAPNRGDDFVPSELEDNDAAPADKKSAAKDDKEGETDGADADADKKDDENEDDDDKNKKKPSIRIPKERLDQEIQKRRAAEARAEERIQALERELAAKASTADIAKLERDIAKKDEEYDDAIADGDKAKAKAVKAELRVLERQLQRAESRAEAAQAKTAAVSELKYDLALSQIELEYPAVNPDSDQFDKDVAAEVADLIDAFKQKGMDPSAALRKAVRYVLGAPKKDAPERDVERDGLREARALEARKKAADAANKTPANLAKHGKDSDAAGGGAPDGKHVAKMSQDEFAKLDAAALAKLRGDDL